MIKFFSILFLAFPFPFLSSAQNWTNRLEEVRIALDKYKDCKTAKSILDEIKVEARGEIMFTYYQAKVYQCMGDIPKYRDYLVEFNKIKNDPNIQEEINELNYHLAKDKRMAQEETEYYNFTSGLYCNKDDERNLYKITVSDDKENVTIFDLSSSGEGYTGNFTKKKSLSYDGKLNIPKKDIEKVVVYNDQYIHCSNYPRESMQESCNDIDTKATIDVHNKNNISVNYLTIKLKGKKCDSRNIVEILNNELGCEVACSCTSDYEITSNENEMELIKKHSISCYIDYNSLIVDMKNDGNYIKTDEKRVWDKQFIADKALLRNFYSRIKHPDSDDGIIKNGLVTLEILVSREGKIENIKILKSLSKNYDDIAKKTFIDSTNNGWWAILKVKKKAVAYKLTCKIFFDS